MSNLTQITLPKSLKKISYGIFYNSGITEITIPENVNYISDRVFYGCKNLTSVIWNARACVTTNKTEYNWYGAFGTTGEHITSFIIGETVDSIPAYLCVGMSSLTGIIIPDNVTYIGDCAFQLCRGLKVVYIGKKVKEIGNYAFQTCTNIESLVWNPEVELIGQYAFQWCTSLPSITIPDSVKVIREGTFQNCTQAQKLTIGKSVRRIEAYAFDCEYQSSPLKKVNYTGDVADWCSIEFFDEQKYLISNPIEYAKALYIKGVLLTDLRLPDGVQKISAGAFCSDTMLNSVYIPQSVQYVAPYAFMGCTNLEHFEYAGNKATCERAIMNCSGLTYLKAPANAFYSPTIGIESLQKYPLLDTLIITNGYLYTTFSNDVHTPVYVDLAGAANTDLQDIQIAGDGVHTLILPQELTRIDKEALRGCRYLSNITIPANVKEIGVSAFEDCRSLNSVVFAGNQVEKIEDWAFYNCHELQNITIPEGVTYIGKAAFYGCTHLKDIVLPSTVETIDDNGFALCSKLRKITIAATTPPTINAKTFEDVDRATPLYVPFGTRNDYAAAPYWKEFINIIETSPTALDNTTTSTETNVQKVFRNRQIYILRGDKTYTLTGVEVE